MSLPYFLEYCTAEQQERWFPGLAAGELLTAIAMTEPGTGSDLAGIRTSAVRDGDHYVLNGAKTFITGGYLADLVIVVARHRDAPPADRRDGLSLLVVEDGMPGFAKGRKLDKIGLKVQDTVELSFNDVRVPVANLLGEEGKAFGYLGHNLPQERLTIAVGSVAQARAALTAPREYAKARLVFGKPLAAFQNTKFELAACRTEVEAAQALLDRALLALRRRRARPARTPRMCKLFTTEMQARVVDRCLQLFGGYGYITEYPIARLYADARVTRIYGGTSEVMKSIISKSLGCESSLGSVPTNGDQSGLDEGIATVQHLQGSPRSSPAAPQGSASPLPTADCRARRLGRHRSTCPPRPVRRPRRSWARQRCSSPADVTDRGGQGGARRSGDSSARCARSCTAPAAAATSCGSSTRTATRAVSTTFMDIQRINLGGTYNVLRLAAARMCENEPVDGDRGAFVLTASVAAFEGQIGQTSYAASKAGVRGITIVAARDLASWGIRVNTHRAGDHSTPRCWPGCGRHPDRACGLDAASQAARHRRRTTRLACR